MIEASELRRIVFGCGNFGGMGSSPALRAKGDGPKQALALLDHARRVGLTRFDTANTYGGGVSETVLGQWLAAQDKEFRARIEVATKVGNPVGCPPGERPLSRAQVAEHLDRSLQRLGLERIDLYYLHEFDPATPLEETLEALDRALAAGKIARFGVSNASLENLRAVLDRTSGALRRAFSHVQNHFNRLETGDLKGVIPLAASQALSYVAFSPLAGGLLTGKYQLGQAAEASTRLAAAPDYYSHLLTLETFAAIDELRRSARENGWTLPGAALRFILDAPGVDALIIAPRTLEQFEAYGLPPSEAT
jgi:aryl-alcohol dehydrogenase-like predicted oxidoreductase